MRGILKKNAPFLDFGKKKRIKKPLQLQNGNVEEENKKKKIYMRALHEG